MIAAAVELADAIKDELNNAPAETFTVAFTAVRDLAPNFETADLEAPSVTVVPDSSETIQATRGRIDRAVTIQIGIRQRLTDANYNASTANIRQTAQEIITHLERKRPAGMARARWLETVAQDPLLSQTLVKEAGGVYATVINMVFLIEGETAS